MTESDFTLYKCPYVNLLLVGSSHLLESESNRYRACVMHVLYQLCKNRRRSAEKTRSRAIREVQTGATFG